MKASQRVENWNIVADIVTPDVRSRMMAGIGGKNTKPELLIRKALHARGLRFRLHRKDLPGKPDLVFSKYRAVLFVNGCFWHGHDCHLFKWPSTRPEFWKQKIASNQARDKRNLDKLRKEDWRIGVIWECAVKGRKRQPVGQIIDDCKTWLLSQRHFHEVSGQ